MCALEHVVWCDFHPVGLFAVAVLACVTQSVGNM